MKLKKSRNLEYNKELIKDLYPKNIPIHNELAFNMFCENLNRFKTKLVSFLESVDECDYLVDLYEFNFKLDKDILNFAEYISDFTYFHKFINPDKHREALDSILKQLGVAFNGEEK